MTNKTIFPLESVVNVNSIVKVTHTIKCESTLLLNDKQDEIPLESVVNVNSIVKVNHIVKCEITWLLNDKQDEVPSRICCECHFYSHNENAKYMMIQDRIRKYMTVHEKYMNKYST